MRSMDSILADEPSVQTLPDGPESDSPSETVTEPEAETSEGATPEPEEAKASTKPAETAKADDEDDNDPDPADFSVAGLRKALTAVRGDKRGLRKKWQDAERKLAQLEGRLSVLQQQPQAQTQPKGELQAEPDVDFYGNPIAHLDRREQAMFSKMEAREFRHRADISEELMREKHEDYEDAKAAFAKAAAQSPWLWNQVAASALPAKVVYQEGRKLLAGYVSEGEAKLKAEIAELKAKIEGSAPSGTTPRAPVKAIPKSNASARGTGASAKPAYSGPRSLEEILGH